MHLQAASVRSDYEHVDMLCIGLSCRTAHSAYDTYETALRRRAGVLGVPVEIRWLAGPDRQLPPGALDGLHGMVFTGGPDVVPARYGEDDPEGVCDTDAGRDAAEFALLDALAARPIPTLGICRGAQILNVFHGGTLIQDLGSLNATHARSGPDDKRHEILVQPGTKLAGIVYASTGMVNSSHHQAVKALARPFRLSATAPDGTIEAYERSEPSTHPFFLAVQWHPERMEPGSPLSDGVLDAFIKAAAD